MGKKRKVYLHVGVTDGPGDFLEAALHEHQHSLAALGVQCPTRNADEMFRAAIEITRRHRAWDYQRREVEGAWAGICRRILKAKGRDDVVISQPLLAGATPEQIDLLVDQLPGLAVHVVVVAERGTGSAHEAADLLARWERAVTKPETAAPARGRARRHQGRGVEGVRRPGRLRDDVPLAGRARTAGAGLARRGAGSPWPAWRDATSRCSCGWPRPSAAGGWSRRRVAA